MKAININGEIKLYSRLPKSWGNIIGGFNTISDSEAESYGFFNVVTPEYNSAIETLGDMFFDTDNNVYTYNVVPLVFDETLDELKETKINGLKKHTNEALAETDWYIIRKTERNIDIPQDVQDSRAAIILSTLGSAPPLDFAFNSFLSAAISFLRAAISFSHFAQHSSAADFFIAILILL